MNATCIHIQYYTSLYSIISSINCKEGTFNYYYSIQEGEADLLLFYCEYKTTSNHIHRQSRFLNIFMFTFFPSTIKNVYLNISYNGGASRGKKYKPRSFCEDYAIRDWVSVELLLLLLK